MAEWKSRRPKNFVSESDANLKRMWRDGIYHKLKGVNSATLHRETLESEDLKNEDESHRPNMSMASINPK